MSHIQSIPMGNEIVANDTPEAFFALLENWDADKFYISKQYRALGLNDQNQIVCKLAIVDPQVDADLTPLLTTAKEATATKVIIGENCISDSLSANEKMWNVYETMQSNAKDMGLELVDHLIMARRSYHSFAANADKRKPQL